MPATIRVASLKAALTANGGTDGYATLASNTGFYPGAKGWIGKADGSLQRRVVFTDLSGATKVGCRIIPEFAYDLNAVHPSYGRSDLSAFSTGAILYMDAQVVEVDLSFQAIQGANIG